MHQRRERLLRVIMEISLQQFQCRLNIILT
jgi:hypothetical protein